MTLYVLLYSYKKSVRIIYTDTDGVMTNEIEHTFIRKCDVVSLRTGGARIRASQQTRNALNALEIKYDIITKYHIRKLNGFISKLADNDEFYFFNEAKTNVVERRTAISCLKADPSHRLTFRDVHNILLNIIQILMLILNIYHMGLMEYSSGLVKKMKISGSVVFVEKENH